MMDTQTYRAFRFLWMTLLIIVSGALLPISASAQGILTGVVKDAETGESLIGVNVIIVGTSLGAATDLDGRFRIENIAAGDFSIRFSYIGYATVMHTGISIQNGEITTLNIDLNEAILSTDDEVVVVGEKPIVDVESSSSTQSMSGEQLRVADLKGVKAAVATQVGVVLDPTGLYIRGGRADEAGYIVDGVSAKDPLAGTGFGLEIGAGGVRSIDLTTGGLGAEIGDATSGVVSVRTRDGGDVFEGSASVKMDNLGFNEDASSNFNESIYELNFGGPIIRSKLHFFVSAQINLSDGFTRQISKPDQLRTSLYSSTRLMPRTGNRWNGISKLTYALGPGKKLQASYQRSYTVNQNTRMLQVTGNDAIVAPGFQYGFVEAPD
ncbi:MAG: TonB-dependent receptor, partial [Bacteroidetes bacterium]